MTAQSCINCGKPVMRRFEHMDLGVSISDPLNWKCKSNKRVDPLASLSGRDTSMDIFLVSESGEVVKEFTVGDEFIVLESRIRIDRTFNSGSYQSVDRYTLTHTVRKESDISDTA